VHAFPVVGRFMAWKVGNETQMRVGTYANVGCGVSIFLLEALVDSL